MRMLFVALLLAAMPIVSGCQMMKNCPMCRTVFGLEKDEIPAESTEDSPKADEAKPAK